MYIICLVVHPDLGGVSRLCALIFFDFVKLFDGLEGLALFESHIVNALFLVESYYLKVLLETAAEVDVFGHALFGVRGLFPDVDLHDGTAYTAGQVVAEHGVVAVRAAVSYALRFDELRELNAENLGNDGTGRIGGYIVSRIEVVDAREKHLDSAHIRGDCGSGFLSRFFVAETFDTGSVDHGIFARHERHAGESDYQNRYDCDNDLFHILLLIITTQ